MKRCPQCYGVYQNTEAYCEVDGQRLLDDPALVVRRDEFVPDAPPRGSHGALAIGFIGLLTGVILCCIAFLIYPFLTAGAEQKTQSERPSLAAQVPEPHTRPAPARVSEALPSPSESPAEEEEAQASPAPLSRAPAEPVAARFNNGPVSTGDQSSTNADGANAKTIIELTGGSKVEVDAAWKDNQGVWYRQGSLVSFVEGPRVKSITARAEPKSSPAANQ